MRTKTNKNGGPHTTPVPAPRPTRQRVLVLKDGRKLRWAWRPVDTG